MQSTQSLQSWLWPGIAPPESDESEPIAEQRAHEVLPAVPPREQDARIELSRLRGEIEHLVRNQRENPRGTVDSALESVTRLQVVTANIDACGPPSAAFAGAALVALADAQLRGHADAIERGMTYTADNQLRLLHDDAPNGDELNDDKERSSRSQ
jgi:hypothetical protein